MGSCDDDDKESGLPLPSACSSSGRWTSTLQDAGLALFWVLLFCRPAWMLAWATGIWLLFVALAAGIYAWWYLLRLPKRHWSIPLAAGALTSCVICSATVAYIREILMPAVLRIDMWEPGIRVLEPGNQPRCDVEAAIAGILQQLKNGTFQYDTETIHWDSDRGACDCNNHPTSAGTCSRPPGSEVNPNITVVHALVDIGRLDRTPCHYLPMMVHHLRRNVSMVVYTERWAIPFIQTIRKQHGLETKTQVRLLQVGKGEVGGAFYQLLPRMEEAATRNFLTDFYIGSFIKQGKSVAKYDWVNHQKIELVRQVAKDNPFGTGYFAWIDAGAGHGAIKVPQNICACSVAVPGTATVFSPSTKEQLLTGPMKGLTLDRYKRWDAYYKDWEDIIGTYWVVHADAVDRFYNDYYRLVVNLLNDGYTDQDQAILALLLAAERPSYLRVKQGTFHTPQQIC